MTTIQKRRPIPLAILATLALVAFAPALVGLRGQSAVAASAQASTSPRVTINHFAFHPPTLRIAKGSSVVFSNTSSTAHTATRAGSFDTGHIKPGRSVSVRFSRKGTFAYHCSIHPFMHGKIVVG
jgi:plastocyanin